MRAIVAVPGSAIPQLVEVAEPPAPRSGELLCRTLELGVCGTDREILHSQQPHLPPGAMQLILGHECLARVEAIGAGVTDLRVGDLIVPLVRRAHRQATWLERERPDLLPFGAFVERGIYEADGFSSPLWIDRPEHVLSVDPALASVAVFAEPLSVCEKAINEALLLQHARAQPGVWQTTSPRVLVTGLGPIAFAGLIAAVARGWPVTVLGRDADDTFRARLVRQFGADYCSTRSKYVIPADIERDGYDLLLECTGSDEVLIEAAQAVRSLGILVWLGSTRTPEPRPLEVARMMRDGILRNHLHLGTVNSARRDFRDALAHLALLQQSHPAALAALFTSRVPLDDAALWHYEHREPQGIKTIVTYEV